MQDERKDEVRDHDFDGIQEFDNRLPNWWVGTFVVTVLFGIYYWTAHHTFQAKPSVAEELSADLADLEKLQAQQGGVATDEEVLALVKDPAELKLGAQIFAANCVACHGQFGQGIIGPNLTDHYWLHGGRPSQIAHTITFGVPDKGMVTWKGVLSPVQIRHAAAFVVSIRDSHPANPKAPQGLLEK